jgi:hypothetical protein
MDHYMNSPKDVEDVCGVEGVKCNEDGDVQSLEIYGKTAKKN